MHRHNLQDFFLVSNENTRPKSLTLSKIRLFYKCFYWHKDKIKLSNKIYRRIKNKNNTIFLDFYSVNLMNRERHQALMGKSLNSFRF